MVEKIEVYFAVFGWKFNLEQSKRRAENLTWHRRRSYLGFSFLAGAVFCSSSPARIWRRAGRSLSMILAGESKGNFSTPGSTALLEPPSVQQQLWLCWERQGRIEN